MYILTPGGKVHGDGSGKHLSQQELYDCCGRRCSPILPTHEELLHLYSTMFASSKSSTVSIEELSLCRDNNDHRYAVYCKRELLEQPLSLEFFVSETIEAV